MRFARSAGVLVLAAVVASGCGAAPKKGAVDAKASASPGASASGRPSAAPNASPGATSSPTVKSDLPGDTKAVCAASTKAIDDGEKAMTAALQEMIAAAGKGDNAGMAAAKKKVADTFTAVATKLDEQAKATGDAKLKPTLTGMAIGYRELAGSLTSDTGDVDQDKLTALRVKITDICGA